VFLGIDKNSYVVYEGGQKWGARPLFPPPSLFSIAIAETPEGALEALKKSDLFTGLIFREDVFDPVSMIRRGRLYQCDRGKGQPAQCDVAPVDEVEIKEARDGNGVVVKTLFTYQGHRLASWNSSEYLFAAIGQRTQKGSSCYSYNVSPKKGKKQKKGVRL